MILSEFIRTIDISWIDFLWMCLWFSLISGTYTAIIWSTGWAISRDRFKRNIMPELMDGIIKNLKAENKELKLKLIRSEKQQELYHDRLLAIKNSSEVRGI